MIIYLCQLVENPYVNKSMSMGISYTGKLYSYLRIDSLAEDGLASKSISAFVGK